MWIAMHHADKEVGRVLRGGFGVRSAFDERRNFKWPVELFSVTGPVPCTLINDFAVQLFPGRDELRGVVDGEDRTRNDGNVGAADNFKHAERVRYFFVTPLIARYDGDAQHFRLRGLNQRQNRLLVRRSGPARVLVDDYFSLPLRMNGHSKKRSRAQEQEESSRAHIQAILRFGFILQQGKQYRHDEQRDKRREE